MSISKLNRRQVLKGGAAIAGASLLSAPTLALSKRPDLVIAVQGLWGGHEPIDAISNVGLRVVNAMFDTLFYRDFFSAADGSGSVIAPSIATAIDRIDAQRVRVKIRKDVKFHNGELLRAEDVAFSFGEKRMFGSEPMSPKAVHHKPDLVEVNVINDEVIEFVTGTPDYAMEKRLASWMSWVVPKDDYLDKGLKGFNAEPIGTGPYKQKEFIPGDRIVLEANDEYFRGVPTARTITFQVVPETATRIAGLVSGQYDIACALNTDNIPLLDRYNNIEGRGAQIENFHLVAHNQIGPLKDKRVRKAMHLCIDHNALNQALWKGLAGVPNGFQMAHQSPSYDANRPYYQQNIAQAKRLLAEAGYNGERISYRTLPNYYTNGLAAAQVMQQWWQQAGLNVEIEIKENWGQVNNESLMSRNWSNGFALADPSMPLTSEWHDKGRAQTKYGWQAPEEYNALLQKVKVSPDGPERKAAFQRALDIFDDEAPGMPLYRPYELYGVKKSIQWQPVTFEWMDLRPHNLSFS